MGFQQKSRNLNCGEREKADNVHIGGVTLKKVILEEGLWDLFRSPYIFHSGVPALHLGKENSGNGSSNTFLELSP